MAHQSGTAPGRDVMRARSMALAAALLIGAAAGLGLFTFVYAKGYSYLGHDPQACANCHVMSEHFAAWTKGSHHTVATCNDCHTPHALIPKYAVKARNGFWHSFYFTVGGYPDPLRITESNRRVTENACRYCHAEITEAIDHVASRSTTPVRFAARTGTGAPASRPHDADARAGEPISCIRCHRYVGHWVR